MGEIGYGYGSEWHLLRYLGYHRDLLDQTIVSSVGCKSISWMDFKFSSKYDPLNQEIEWKGIQFLQNDENQQQWNVFWPASGNPQNWDAIGKVHFDDRKEWLLVEAKAHIAELKSKCGATNRKSKEMIRMALLSTQSAMNVSPDFIENWLNTNYQYCNRLAVLHFFHNICRPPVLARLLFIYFYGERHPGMDCPSSPFDWEMIVKDTEKYLGIPESHSLSKNIHHIYLPVNPNC
jgi:hypothetical protein